MRFSRYLDKTNKQTNKTSNLKFSKHHITQKTKSLISFFSKYNKQKSKKSLIIGDMFSGASLIKIIDTSHKINFLSILFITVITSSSVALNRHSVFGFLGIKFEKSKLDSHFFVVYICGVGKWKWKLNDWAIIAGSLVACSLMKKVLSALCNVRPIKSLRNFQFSFWLLSSELNLCSKYSSSAFFKTSFRAL